MKNKKILQERQYNNALKTLEKLRKIKTEMASSIYDYSGGRNYYKVWTTGA